jgi:hypothetical protein
MTNGAASQMKWWLLCAHKLVLINGDLSSGTHFTYHFTAHFTAALLPGHLVRARAGDRGCRGHERRERRERSPARRRGWQVLNLLALLVE